jgi:ubiquinone/menaquinone biosynthesis C-methylase UbiE
MSGAFSRETASYYELYRRGYPDAVVDAVVDRLGLNAGDMVIDLGCGTGLLTAPFARRVRLAIGVDPEPDMLPEDRREAFAEHVARALPASGCFREVVPVTALIGVAP